MDSLNVGRMWGRWMAVAWTALLLGTVGCGAADSAAYEAEPEVDSVSEEITGGWTTLTLINGWQNRNITSPPAVGRVNGTIRFRGCLRGPNATSPVAFILPTSFGTVNPNALNLRMVMSGNSAGMLALRPIQGVGFQASILQDGVTSGVGAAARELASLDGISFDYSGANATALVDATGQGLNGWTPLYPFRLQGNASVEPGASAKLVDGFVRFQGLLMNYTEAANRPLFRLPPAFRPGQAVYVPINEGISPTKHGRLNVYPNGDVYLQAESPGPTGGIMYASLEGANYSLTTGGTSLTLVNGWVPYSPRAVKARLNNGVVRLEGAVRGGTSQVITTLPANMRPPTLVYLLADSYGAQRARLTVATNGDLRVNVPVLSSATQFVSLDGVSFSL